MFSNLLCRIKNKLKATISRKKRSLDRMQQMGLENYLKVKIERYADSPALVAHFKSELDNLKAKI